MVGHKTCFNGEIGLNTPNLSLLLLLIWSTAVILAEMLRQWQFLWRLVSVSLLAFEIHFNYVETLLNQSQEGSSKAV